MASDLPRVRVDDDGRVAVADNFGWRDAVIVPLPEPDEIHEHAGTGWRATEDVVWASQTAIFDGTHLYGAVGARIQAAALLAAADHLDQAKAVNSDG